jgi:unconventional prefoldin RPB5 interactor 1
VGAVVAEIVLDEDDSDGWTDDDDPDAWTDEEELNEGSSEEDEDQYGRTKRRVVSEDYRQEMLALEEKLNVRSIRNIGPGENISLLPRKALEHEIKLNSMMDEDGASLDRKTSPTKEVRFADLQIQDAVSHKTPFSSSSNTQNSPPQDPPSSKKTSISRFKAERTNSTPSTKTKPHNGIIASSVLERPYNPIPLSSTAPPKATASDVIPERPYDPEPSSPPAPPSTEDPTLLHQQLTTEYHRLRNRMIYRQGGFLADDEEEEEEEVVDENADENGRDAGLGQQHQDSSSSHNQGVKKMSRFRAARLKGISASPTRWK